MPEEYLADYYHEVKPDELQTIAFFVAAMKQVEPGEPILLFGVGPTLHHVFLAAGKASEIHLADYLWTNLDEIEKWIRRDAHAHDWRAFVRDTFQCKGITSPTDEQVWQREELTRGKITKLLQVDARHADPLRERNGSHYGTVISAYCPDSAPDRSRFGSWPDTSHRATRASSSAGHAGGPTPAPSPATRPGSSPRCCGPGSSRPGSSTSTAVTDREPHSRPHIRSRCPIAGSMGTVFPPPRRARSLIGRGCDLRFHGNRSRLS